MHVLHHILDSTSTRHIAAFAVLLQSIASAVTFKALVNLDMSFSFRKPLETWIPLHSLKTSICDHWAPLLLFLFVRPGGILCHGGVPRGPEAQSQ